MKVAIVVTVLGMFSNAAMAALIFTDCQSETARFCGKDENAKCLLAHDKELSPLCKEDIERYLTARREATARGGGALTAFGGLNAMGPPVPLFSYDGRYMFGEKSPTLMENKMNLSAPVFRSDQDTYAMSVAAGELHLGDHVALDSGVQVPTDLARVEVGAQYFHQLSENRNWGLRASVGYAGDKPAKDLSYGVSGNYGFPGSGNGYWVLLVFMANNGPFINYVPIPGFLYIYKTPTFTGMFGFPILSMQWTPVDPWIYSVAVFGPTVQSEVAYGHRDQVQAFGGYSLNRQSYIPSVRPEERDRLTFQEQKLAAGIRFMLSRTWLFEFQAGESFGRSIYIGDGLLKKDGGSATLANDGFVSWGLKFAF